jgi:hypothetical protein
LEHIGELVGEHKPRVAIFCGRHEPFEPSYRIMKMKTESGRELHEELGRDVLVIRLPAHWQSYNFGMRKYGEIKKLADDMQRRQVLRVYSPEDNSRVGKALEGSIKEMEETRDPDTTFYAIFGRKLRQNGVREMGVNDVLRNLGLHLAKDTYGAVSDREITKGVRSLSPRTRVLHLHYNRVGGPLQLIGNAHMISAVSRSMKDPPSKIDNLEWDLGRGGVGLELGRGGAHPKSIGYLGATRAGLFAEILKFGGLGFSGVAGIPEVYGQTVKTTRVTPRATGIDERDNVELIRKAVESLREIGRV